MSLGKLIESLNSAQREVVALRTHCLAVAVPGAGKTATIAAKAASLLLESEATVGAVTFSKDAAIELRDRILALAGDGVRKRLIAGTFHSLAYRQLRKEGSVADNVATEGLRRAIVSQILREAGIEWKVDDALATIERIKAGAGVSTEDTVGEGVCRAYQDALARNGKLDFQDMLRQAVRRMEDGTISPYRLNHLLVDEYQDCDALQARWAALHAASGSVVTVVGDDDQSIYGFRLALGVRGMQDFARSLGARTIVLGQNYRSRSEILGAADALIRHNEDRIAKDLVADRGPGGSVTFERLDNEYQEAGAAVDALAPVLERGSTAAVLARTNRMLDPIEAICRARGIKYFRAAGKSILDRPEVALMGELLELIAGKSGANADALLGFVGISVEERARLAEGGGVSRKDLVDAGIPPLAVDRYRDFMKRLHAWRALSARAFYALVLDGVHEWMLKFAATDAGKRALDTAYGVLTRLEGSLFERLAFLRRANNAPDSDALVLTTMHASKGREWSAVAILRAEETVVPDSATAEAEERRLFYVAITRARDELRISSARKHPTSRFVGESGLR
ncbi:ATP-dependent helicase [Cupriavidus pauculus]|uniref:ATP-dependent helicase n=1 Tax=Cupriavidus pauculus TaxID=82633 RepID=UPI001EE209F0|nr:ATP-dependent helicase [Cupriavidus pauculus]GJG97771.1 ATP-dependent helicase [Cupriavidus pauculus]